MSSADDSILILRDAFDSIEPAAAQQARWSARVAQAARARAAQESVQRVIAAEPLPWRLIGIVSAAAVITIAAFAAIMLGGAEGRGGEPSRAAGGWSLDRAMVLAEPAVETDLAAPESDPRMQMDVPATGIDFRTHWETFRTVIDFALGGDEQASS